MAVERIGDDRTAPSGRNASGGRPGAAFLSREECELCSQGKKGANGRCGRTIEAQPVSDQTCHIEDVVAAPVLIKPDGFRRWRAVIVDFHILPSPMRSPAALRALLFLGLASSRSRAAFAALIALALDRVGGRVG